MQSVRLFACWFQLHQLINYEMKDKSTISYRDMTSHDLWWWYDVCSFKHAKSIIIDVYAKIRQWARQTTKDNGGHLHVILTMHDAQNAGIRNWLLWFTHMQAMQCSFITVSLGHATIHPRQHRRQSWGLGVAILQILGWGILGAQRVVKYYYRPTLSCTVGMLESGDF